MEHFSLRFTGSPVFSFCICWTIVSDSSELNTVKQGREEWRSKCSKISVGRNRSRHNFFFSTNTKYVNRRNKKEYIFFVNCVWSFPLFFIIQLLTIENHFPRGLGCCLRDSLLFVCSVLKETRLHSQTGEELKVKRVYWISTCNDAALYRWWSDGRWKAG